MHWVTSSREAFKKLTCFSINLFFTGFRTIMKTVIDLSKTATNPLNAISRHNRPSIDAKNRTRGNWWPITVLFNTFLYSSPKEAIRRRIEWKFLRKNKQRKSGQQCDCDHSCGQAFDRQMDVRIRRTSDWFCHRSEPVFQRRGRYKFFEWRSVSANCIDY